MSELRIVNFAYYCPKCKYYPKEEGEDPCCECLDNPTNVRSYKPVKFEEAKRRQDQNEK